MSADIVEVDLPRAMRRRLERMELESLRAIVAEMQERVERLEERAYSAEQAADCWQDLALRLQDESPKVIGLTKEGHMLVLEPEDE